MMDNEKIKDTDNISYNMQQSDEEETAERAAFFCYDEAFQHGVDMLALYESDTPNDEFLKDAFCAFLGRMPGEYELTQFGTGFSCDREFFRIITFFGLMLYDERKDIVFPVRFDYEKEKNVFRRMLFRVLLSVYRKMPAFLKMGIKGKAQATSSADKSESVASVKTGQVNPLPPEYPVCIGKYIRQMAVLTARTDDILRSLPFIERFMPFIEELVVCCPIRIKDEFTEKYRGRLNLRFITDDELLCGEKLPSDHQARNFFLRCRLLEQDILDDVFIMTDDDYRPMKMISEDVFVSDGKYRCYYFYDLRNWQGTYNNYTSFDKGAFRTREFLEKSGYQTLQYSSHQPQVIDRRIFREMLEMHKGIEKFPFDEWSVYFNYGVHHYPDRFIPTESVSMCWPASPESWDICHIPDEYLFENFYSELYDEGGIFSGFSEEFSDSILTENARKSEIYRNLCMKQKRQNEVFQSFRDEYLRDRREYPAAVICSDLKSRKPLLSLPPCIRLASDAWTRFPVGADKALFSDDRDVFISYRYSDKRGVPFLSSPELRIDPVHRRFLLPVRSPEMRGGELSLSFCVTVRKRTSHRKISRTERSIRLVLVNTDEVQHD